MQHYGSDGTALGDNQKINDDEGDAIQNPPDVAADDNGNFIVTWSDKRNEVWPDKQLEIFARRFDSNGTPIGTDFKVTGRSTTPYELIPAVKLFNHRIYTTWVDTDRLDLGTGSDIWVNVLDWDNPVGIESDDIPVAPTVFTLNQNYPNPFNPVTTINYQLPARSAGGPITNYVEIVIYNNLGHNVATLVSEKQPAGIYQVEWNAGGFASGLYFYRLNAGNFFKTCRMLLLK